MTDQPTISIIIPTYNRPTQLRKCLESLQSQDLARNRFEVIVVNDGGSFNLDDIWNDFHYVLDLHLVRQGHGGPAKARNRGATTARGQLLVFTDDDCRPAPTWLSMLDRETTLRPDRLIGGCTLNGLVKNPFSAASQLLIDYLYSYYNSDPLGAQFLTSNNLAVSTAGFHAIGGFDEAFPLAAGEDRDFCDRWLNANRKISFVAEARILHYHSLNPTSFWRQHFNYGRAALHVHQKRSRRASRERSMESASFYLRLLHYPYRQRRDRSWPCSMALLFFAQLANGVGLVSEAASQWLKSLSNAEGNCYRRGKRHP